MAPSPDDLLAELLERATWEDLPDPEDVPEDAEMERKAAQGE
jgi:hypothetical protein